MIYDGRKRPKIYIFYILDADGEQVICYNNNDLFVRLSEQEVIMKQPSKLTAYYYRAANMQTDLNLDNQMHQLLHHAAQSGVDAYLLFVDNGCSGLSLYRPAMSQLQMQMADRRIEKVVVTNIDRISRNTNEALIFFRECVRNDVRLETVDGEALYPQFVETLKLYEALCAAYTAKKGGERK